MQTTFRAFSEEAAGPRTRERSALATDAAMTKDGA